ncbi:MAG: hypothetical protein K9K64_15175 [Desulfohalobiaceae bacterium]|nr:hypothetical protein [Desulfohalobiaceae bacterium]
MALIGADNFMGEIGFFDGISKIRDVTERKRLEKQLIGSYLQIQNARNLTKLGLAKLAEYRDQDTGFHLERIREYTKITAKELAGRKEYKEAMSHETAKEIVVSLQGRQFDSSVVEAFVRHE